MKTGYVGVVLAVVLGLAGCLHEDSGPRYVISWASADSVVVLSARALTVQFEVFGAKPTPCHEVIEPVITEDGSTRRVTVEMRSRVRRNIGCVQVLASHQTTIVVPVSASGAWEFAFHDGLGSEPTVIGVTVPN
jgi:hypothetical protein